MAKILNWNIDKIVIYPFGGCVKFNESINKPIYQEILILLSGPIFQLLLFAIVNILFNNNLIILRNYLIFKNYHYTLLSFNLLPVYPLDGGKLLNLICNFIFPYKKGNKIIIYISYIIVFIMFLNYKSLNFYLMGIFLIIEITMYLKNQKFLFNKFLLERYLNNYKFKHSIIINNKNNMFKEKEHLFIINNKYYTEKEYLNNRYK